MTIVSTIATATLGWTGVETAWNPGFQAQGITDVSAIYYPFSGGSIALTLGTHYTASLDSNGNYAAAPAAYMPAASGTVQFLRNSTLQQEAAFQDGVPPSAETLGAALDLCALRDQELRRDLSTNFTAMMTAWMNTLPLTPGAFGTWWSNDGAPTMVRES